MFKVASANGGLDLCTGHCRIDSSFACFVVYSCCSWMSCAHLRALLGRLSMAFCILESATVKVKLLHQKKTATPLHQTKSSLFFLHYISHRFILPKHFGWTCRVGGEAGTQTWRRVAERPGRSVMRTSKADLQWIR